MIYILQTIVDNMLPVVLAFIGAFGTIVGIVVAVYNIARKTGSHETKLYSLESSFESRAADMEKEIEKYKQTLYAVKDKHMLQEHIILDMQRILTSRVDASNDCQKQNQVLYKEIAERMENLALLLSDHLTTHRVEKQTRKEMHDEIMNKKDANTKK